MAEKSSKVKAPKGTLIPIGGAEKRIDGEESSRERRRLAVLRRVVAEMGGPKAQIEVLATASSIPDEISDIYDRSFAAVGCKNVGILNVRNRRDARKPSTVDRLLQADGLMFSGGDQRKIIRAFADTEFHEIMLNRYQNEDFVIAGTSAGAMMMSGVMIFGGQSKGAMVDGKAKTTQGLGLMPNAIIDSHFVVRGRFGRMAVAIAENPESFGIGLGEDTGVVIKKGRYLECIGSGHVSLYDGTKMKNMVQDDDDDDFPVTFEGMVFSVMSRGYHFDMQKRCFMKKSSS
jgi:cyanophycinase